MGGNKFTFITFTYVNWVVFVTLILSRFVFEIGNFTFTQVGILTQVASFTTQLKNSRYLVKNYMRGKKQWA